jgi:NaMN:DMB phosphoribosyltransferase
MDIINQQQVLLHVVKGDTTLSLISLIKFKLKSFIIFHMCQVKDSSFTYEGSLKTSWTRPITPSRNFVEVR